MVKKISSKLDLDKAQKQSLNKMKDELMAKASGLRSFRKEVSSEILKQAQSDKVDTEKLNQMFESKSKEFTEMRKLLIDKYAEFHSILNSEQRQELVSLLKKFRGRHGLDE